ncbi:MAG: hypothetical protein GX801_10850 [Fibrobacter sp.]|nr:hypothetical protein [Fibrobacter sp.]
MLISYIILGFTIALLFVFPVEMLLPFTLAIYSQLVLFRLYQKKYIKIDFIIFAIYLSMFFMYKALKLDNILPYVGSLFYFFIGFSFLISGLIKNPLTITEKESKTAGEINYHSFMNVILGVFYLLCLYLSLSLMPKPSYIYMPLVLVVFSIPMSMLLTKYLNQPYFDFYYDTKFRLFQVKKAQKKHFGNAEGFGFIIGDYIGKEVISKSDHEKYLAVLKKAYYDLYVQSKVKKQDSYDVMWEEIRAEHKEISEFSTCFVVQNIKDGSSVGAIRLIHKKGKTQIEPFSGLDFTGLRDKGIKIAEIGRFAITCDDGASRGVVLKLLFHLLGYSILKNKVDIAYTFAFNTTTKIYEKIGFTKHKERIFDEEFLMDGNLLALNFRENFKSERSLIKAHQSFWANALMKYYYLGFKGKDKKIPEDLFRFN